MESPRAGKDDSKTISTRRQRVSIHPIDREFFDPTQMNDDFFGETGLIIRETVFETLSAI